MDMHTILRPQLHDGAGMLRLREVEINGHVYSDRVHGGSVSFNGDSVAEIVVEFLTETPLVYAVTKGKTVERPQPGFVPPPEALVGSRFDAQRLCHPVAEGWRVAQETASPFVSLGMWEHCDDCSDPALYRVPFLDLDGQRFSEFVSVEFLPVAHEFAKNGSGDLVRGCAWIARIEMCGTAAIEPI